MLEALSLVGQRDLDFGADSVVGRERAAAEQPLVLDVVVFADVKVDVDWILRDDQRQQRRVRRAARRDPASEADIGAAQATVDGCGDARKRKLELRSRDLGFRDLERRLGLPVQARAILEHFLRHDLPLHERPATLDVELGIVHLGARLGEFGLRLPQHPLERSRIDHEQQIAFLHRLAVDEGDLIDVSGDAGANLDVSHRLEAAGVLVPLNDAADDRLARRDRGGRWSRRLGRIARLRAVACREREARQQGTERQRRNPIPPKPRATDHY